MNVVFSEYTFFRLLSGRPQWCGPQMSDPSGILFCGQAPAGSCQFLGKKGQVGSAIGALVRKVGEIAQRWGRKFEKQKT